MATTKFRWIANAVTMCNLIFGFLAIILSTDGYYLESSLCVFAAMIADGLDGRVARKLNIVSDLGMELDSLSDLISFGVAPAFLLYNHQIYIYGWIGVAIAIGFAMCGAYRLARFNALNIKTYFVGVPITLCGPTLVLCLMLHKWIPDIAYPFIAGVLGFLMVSKIKVPKI